MEMMFAFEPFAPWHWVVTVLGGVTLVGLLLRFLVDGGRALGTRWWVRLCNLLLTAVALTLLAVAVWNPVQREEPELGAVHLAVVLDVSDSVQRVDGGWNAVRRGVGDFVIESVRQLPADLIANGTGSIATFQDGAAVAADNIALSAVGNAIKGISDQSASRGQGSNLAAGLQTGWEQVRENGGRGAILLVTDGNQTAGDALEVTSQIGQQGIPIYVLPINSGRPELAIESLNFADQVNANTEAYIRGVMANDGDDAADATLWLAKNPDLADVDTVFGAPLESNAPLTLGSGKKELLRQPIMFDGVGLQFIDLVLSDATRSHHRRFFTHVNKPAEFLALGGDFEWVRAIDPDVAVVEQVQVKDADLPNSKLDQYDAIVISDVAADELGAENIAAIVAAVEQEGVGLMLLNGDHGGLAADEEQETIIKSYENTPLGPLLPVTTEPRPETDEPPPRRIIFLLDTSGSMQGQKLDKAREIIRHVVLNLLNQNDTIDLLLFTTDVVHEIENAQLDETNLNRILNTIEGGFASGGTDPTRAVALINTFDLGECALIFMSDGEFNANALRAYTPECRATVFDIGQEVVDPNNLLYQIADPIAVGVNFPASEVTIPYFEPEERDKFFEKGVYPPAMPGKIARGGDAVPLPDISLEGNAITYAKPNAEMMVIRPKFRDPVLAYRVTPGGNGYAGVFTTGLTEEWLNTAAGREAVQAWMMRLVPYRARDRYHFDLQDNGVQIDFQLSVLAQDGRAAPDVTAVAVTLEIDGKQTAVTMTPDTVSPATFVGRIDVPRTENSQIGTLIIEESGRSALTRPQHIPIIIPLAGQLTAPQTDEATTYGTDVTLLATIAELSEGKYDPSTVDSLFQQTFLPAEITRYWVSFAVGGAVAYLGAIAIRRWDG